MLTPSQGGKHILESPGSKSLRTQFYLFYYYYKKKIGGGGGDTGISRLNVSL